MSIYDTIAERRIRQAMDRGEFDNLAGAGKPLPPDDLEKVPEEMRMACKILKNAGILPEEIELRKSIAGLNDLIALCSDEKELRELRIKLNAKQLKYNMIMDQRGIRTVDPQYNARIMEKLT